MITIIFTMLVVIVRGLFRHKHTSNKCILRIFLNHRIYSAQLCKQIQILACKVTIMIGWKLLWQVRVGYMWLHTIHTNTQSRWPTRGSQSELKSGQFYNCANASAKELSVLTQSSGIMRANTYIHTYVHIYVWTCNKANTN